MRGTVCPRLHRARDLVFREVAKQGHCLAPRRIVGSQRAERLQRLGGERHARLRAIMQAALAEQERSGEVSLHLGWIEGLLSEYYDPMYAFQRESNGERIEFSGDQPAVLEYLSERAARAK